MAAASTEGAPRGLYTPAFAFFESLWDAGVTHCFCNLGSDHPSILDAIVKGQEEKPDRFPTIITCPTEMVAMSMADGFARVTGRPQAVIVHVDVGTQALGCAVHNASVGRVPLLVFAGLSPFTIEGELKGSRTEYIQWLQDVHNQKAIVEQYCRYSGEVRTGANIKQLVNRALSFATSDPKGPVYLCAAREVLEAELDPYQIKQQYWAPIEPAALTSSAVRTIADALVTADEPLIVTGFTGRDKQAPHELVKLANTIKGLRVLDAGGSDMSFPADHRGWLGCSYSGDKCFETADVILVLDCDVPWIPTRWKPNEEARVFHIDVDPLKQNMPLNEYIESNSSYKTQLQSTRYSKRWSQLLASYEPRLQTIEAAARPDADGHFGTAYLINQVRKVVPDDSIFVVEAITNTQIVAEHLQVTLPGAWYNCGGGGLGWSGGGALGVKLATDCTGANKFVCQIVGDGSYLFSFPGSVYWIAKRYDIPVLTIVLNNNGWNAPRKSLLLVNPDGPASKVANRDLNISFTPTPDYAGIAKAAGHGDVGAFRASTANDLRGELATAVKFVLGGKSAVFDAHIGGPKGKYTAVRY
ncbi:acetolactate synthase [Fusarium oxysporum]|nr:acetolactate synthase [Fusarium oxysporum]